MERITQYLQLHIAGWIQKDIAGQLNTYPNALRRYLRSLNPKALSELDIFA